MLFTALVLWCASAIGSDLDGRAIDAYVAPYVSSGNFSGQVLVASNGKIIFQKAYGEADRERHVRNTAATRFHIASMSMQYTAAAILRLVDQHSLTLDTSVGDLLPDTPGADKIRIRDLLSERSGLPDINELPDYDQILQDHQTPSSLVAKVQGKPLLFEPGSQFLHEEHSAYNLLALIVQKKTGLPFAAAVNKLVFKPLQLSRSSIDDDWLRPSRELAKGYQPRGVSELAPAAAIHWSAKTGNASVVTTAADQEKWLKGLLGDRLLTPGSRAAMLDTAQPVGYGWFKRQNKRFNEVAFSMNGRAPGFASFILYLPQEKTTVIVFSNIYSSATTTIGNDIAAIALNRSHGAFQPGAPLSSEELRNCTGSFRFGSNFYQPNAEVSLAAEGNELSMRWPSGEVSPLIPLGKDRFLDRAYWEDVSIERGSDGRPVAIRYDQYRGDARP